MVAVDVEDEAVLGVVHVRIRTRPTKQIAATRPRTIEDKESLRWNEGSTAAGERLRGAEYVIIVADQESDIYSQLARTPPGAELIVRTAGNRKLTTMICCLRPSDWRELGAMGIDGPPHRPGEATRVACGCVKAGLLTSPSRTNGVDRSDPAM
jgi:hypothetical protein